MAEGPHALTEATVNEPVLEDRLAGVQDQLDRLKAQVRQAQQLAHLGTVAATIAHEVNNLLTPIRSYAQAALDSNDPSLREKALTVTLKNVEMLVAMTGRVLEVSAAKAWDRRSVSVRKAAEDAVASLCRDLSKDGIRFRLDVDESLNAFVDPLQLQQVFFNLFLNARNAMVSSRDGRLVVAGRRDGDRVVVDVSDSGPGIAPGVIHIQRKAAEDAVASLCRDLSKDGIRFRLDVDESLNAFVDPLQLQQVFFNLFLNARNAMVSSRDGRLVVAGRRDGDRVVVDVSDSGPGIAPGVIEHIFDALETTKLADQDGKQRCAGLGLALCRDLIEENDGQITVASRPTEGTTFSLYLPVK